MQDTDSQETSNRENEARSLLTDKNSRPPTSIAPARDRLPTVHIALLINCDCDEGCGGSTVGAAVAPKIAAQSTLSCQATVKRSTGDYQGMRGSTRLPEIAPGQVRPRFAFPMHYRTGRASEPCWQDTGPQT